MVIDSDTAHSLTRMLMATAFLTAMFFCAQSRNRGLALFYLIAAIETYAKLRYPFHVWVRDVLLSYAPDNLSKQDIQAAFMLTLTMSSIFVAIWLTRKRRRYPWPKMLMLAGMLGTLCLLTIELISPHDVDAIIYKVDGVFLRSGWIYAVMALTSAVGAVYARKRKQTRRQRPAHSTR